MYCSFLCGCRLTVAQRYCFHFSLHRREPSLALYARKYGLSYGLSVVSELISFSTCLKNRMVCCHPGSRNMDEGCVNIDIDSMVRGCYSPVRFRRHCNNLTDVEYFVVAAFH